MWLAIYKERTWLAIYEEEEHIDEGHGGNVVIWFARVGFQKKSDVSATVQPSSSVSDGGEA